MPSAEEKYQYDQEYIKQNLVRVLITFNKKKEEDMRLYNFLAAQPKMSAFIKELIQKAMNNEIQ